MKRPSHPDLWLLSRILIDQDKVSESGKTPFGDQLGRVVDPEVITYVAQQRALRVAGIAGGGGFVIAGTWLDGFMAGAAFQAAKEKEQQADG